MQALESVGRKDHGVLLQWTRLAWLSETRSNSPRVVFPRKHLRTV